MKILTPVKNLLSWIEIIKNWADEIYFWVVSDSWEGKHGYKSILNRRDWSLANISSYKEWKQLIDYARKNWVESYITLNNSPIIVDLELIKKEIKNAILIKPDALIVKDIFIADLIRKIDKDIAIHCSSLNQVINSQSIKYWEEKYNITRIIFPRNISANEVKELCLKFPKLEFEIFVKNDWCYNSDWICSSLHLEWLKNWMPYVCNRESRYKTKDENFQKKYLDLYKKTLDCKICILSELKDIKNLVSLKIVWREKPLPIILNDLNFIKNSVKYLELTESNKEFIDFNIRLHKKILKKDCWYKWCEFYNMNYE